MIHRKGFTLIELLVVITIIAVLLAMLTPALDRAMLITDATRCAANLHGQYLAVNQYSTDHKTRLPPVDAAGYDMTPGGFRTRNFSAAGNSSYNLGYLWKTRHITTGQTFFCPSQQNPIFTYATHSNPSFPTDYTPSVGGSSAVRVSYTFCPIATSPALRTRLYRKFTQLDSEAITVVDLIEEQGSATTPTSISHIELEGFNVLRGQGSVDLVDQVASRYIINRMRSDPGGLINTNYALWDEVMERLVHPR